MGQVQALPRNGEAGTALGTIQADFEHVCGKASADFEDFFENGGIALHLVGADGTILRANKAELELLGFAAHEYIGRHIAEFHADRDVIENMLARLNVGERLDRYPARLRARDGSIKHVEITSSAQFRDGRFINTRCFTIDVPFVAVIACCGYGTSCDGYDGPVRLQCQSSNARLGVRPHGACRAPGDTASRLARQKTAGLCCPGRALIAPHSGGNREATVQIRATPA